jgi:hypothetical protein
MERMPITLIQPVALDSCGLQKIANNKPMKSTVPIW